MKIEIYVNLYEIFMVHIGNLDVDTMRRLLNLNFGILEFIYREWLIKEDSFFDELRSYACDELEILSESENKNHREEGEDAAGFDKAA